ncbi:MAG: hypothetical protein HQK51_06215 [Oligoflexia bacterium]|nr:hypothetical protein [Oligoflexia bacterium]
MTLCKLCVLSSNFPNIDLDEECVCKFCKQQNLKNEQKSIGLVEKNNFDSIDKIINALKGKYEYDAICCYSGGKDSTFMLQFLKKRYNIRVLAFTLDNGFIVQEAKENISKVVEYLEIDHVYYRPNARFLKKLFQAAIRGDLFRDSKNYHRISDICLSCITMINVQAACLAIQKKIPIIFAGFTSGQTPRSILKNHYLFYKESFNQNKVNFERILGTQSNRYFDIDDSDFDIYQISPNMLFNHTEKEIVESIKAMGWINPENLDGCSSNCKLNALGVYVHMKRFKFHPYEAELSNLVRKGVITRSEALDKLNQNVSINNINEMLSHFDTSIVDD